MRNYLSRTTYAVLAFAGVLLMAAYFVWTTQRPYGLSEKDIQGWYRASQGSRLIPVSWFQALERPEGSGRFADEQYLLSFGYLAAPKGDNDRLPIGFARDDQPDDQLSVTRLRWYAGQENNAQWLGLNCAACHTSQLTYKGTTLAIEGGPGLGDLQSLVGALNQALKETLSDQSRFARFAANVLKGRESEENLALLRAAVAKLYTRLETRQRMNAAGLRYGLGRVDAFGHIFNSVVAFANPNSTLVNPSDAPVSYPFLWNSHKQFQVQYNGIAKNFRAGSFEYGAMGRNSGEVIGVFGEVIVTPVKSPGDVGPLAGYVSSLNINNLDLMERVVHKFPPPQWPSMFPPIDKTKLDRGQHLFRNMCSGCHLLPDQQKRVAKTETILPIKPTEASNRTDIWMACNAFMRQAPSGLLQGTRLGYFNFKKKDGFPAIAPIAQLLDTMVKGALFGKKSDIIKSNVEYLFGAEEWDLSDIPVRPPLEVFSKETLVAERRRRQVYCETKESELLVYKARPLDGIWATAPYLHNGSVPSLYALLLPAKDRPRRFWVTREFDPTTVGLANAEPTDGIKFEFRTVDDDGEPIYGNGAMGHEYGVGGLTEQDRGALLEFIKLL